MGLATTVAASESEVTGKENCRAGKSWSTRIVTADHTVLDDKDHWLVLDGTSASVDATLPSASTVDPGTEYCFTAINISNTVRVVGTINGGSNYTFAAQYESVTVRSTGSAWVMRRGLPAVILNTDLAAGILSADTTGRALMATDYFNEATVDAKFAASSIDDDRLKALGTTRLMGGRDIGRAGVFYFYLTGVASDTELVTIGGRTYEFDTDATSTGDVAVDISGDATADAACTALAAAVNGDGSTTFYGVVMGGNADTNAGVMFVETSVTGSNSAVSTDCANGVVSAANTTGAAALANRDHYSLEYTVTAADVTQLATTGGNSIVIAGIPSTSAPTLTSLFVRTSAGAVVPLVATLVINVSQVNSAYYIVTLDDGAATLTAGDTIGMALDI